MQKFFFISVNVWIILCAALGGILYGYDIGVISGAILSIKASIPMDNAQLGLIVGAVLGGGLLGNLVTGTLADSYGRKKMILSACIIFILGVLLIMMANSFEQLFFARLTLGLGVGVISVAVPLYITEISPTHMRGRGMTAFQLFLTFGILLAYIIDLFFTQDNNWRAMFAVILVPAVILFFGMLCLPETPRWLLAKQRKQAARKVLGQLWPESHIQSELAIIESGLKKNQGQWLDLFKKNLLLPLSISLFIAIANQLTGINIIFQYAPLVLEKAGFTSHQVLMLGTIGLGAVNFFTTIISILLIDFVGRKRLLLFGTAGIVVAATGLIIIEHLGLSQAQSAFYSLAFLMVYVFSFAIGPGVVVWLAISELLPTKVRGKAIALCLFANSLSATVFASLFLYLTKAIGMEGIYTVFALSTLAYFLVAHFYLPETKARTLESIQLQFQGDKESSDSDSHFKA